MAKKKEFFSESDWVRTAPKWKFWDKQEVKTISCTKCDWTETVDRLYSGAMHAYLSQTVKLMSLRDHAQTHKKKKKK